MGPVNIRLVRCERPFLHQEKSTEEPIPSSTSPRIRLAQRANH